MTEPRFEATDGLTRDDIAAFRASTEWSLHLGPSQGSFIRLYMRGDERKGPVPIYTARQQVLFPDASQFMHSRVRDIVVTATAYGFGSGGVGGWSWRADASGPAPECFATPSQKPFLDTISRALREGDLLELHWVADNNSDNIRRVNYHADEAILWARHPTKPKNEWPLVHQVGPDNSARMIRRS